MAIHFHCTDGVDLIVDRGTAVARRRKIASRQARAVADEIMRSLPGYDGWQDWAVHVCDERGELGIVPFLEAAPRTGSSPA